MLTRLLLVVLFCACAFSLPAPLENGFFDGRSGDIVIQPKNVNTQSHLAFLGASAPKLNTEASLKDTEVADLLSHLLGTATLNANVDRSTFPKRDFFNTPKANLLFVVDADAQAVREMNAMGGAQLQAVDGQAFPYDSATALNSILTGSLPSKHGIVQESWYDNKNGLDVGAFESWCPGRSGARSASLQDITGLVHGGRSLVLSFASDLATTRAMSTKPYLLKDTANNFGLYFDGSSYASVYLDRVMQIDVDSPSQLLAGQSVPEVLDASVPEIAALLSEVAFVMALPDRIRADEGLRALVEDSTPDYYSLAFTSLKALRAKYGVNHAVYVAALKLVDVAITKMATFVEQAYNGKALIEVLVLPSVSYENQEQIVEKTKATLFPQLAAETVVDTHFPQVYLAKKLDVEQRETACSFLTEVLAGVDAQVYCMPVSSAVLRQEQAELSERDDANNGTGDGTDDSSEVATFQIVLWSSIALILMTIAASALMFTIDASKDTMIYNQHNQITIKTI